MRGLLRGDRDGQGLGIGEADVLGGEDDQAPRHEHHVLTRLQHPGHPVDGRVGIAAAHALDQRRDDVVVLVAGAVIEQVPLLQRLLDLLQRDGAFAGQPGRRLETVERHPRISAGDLEERIHRVTVDGGVQLLQPALHDLLQLVPVELLEAEDPAPRKQRRDDLEGRVLGRGADQRHGAVLHVGQDRVLLRLVEAVDLVDEEDRAQAGTPVHLGLGDDLSQVRHAGRHCGHGHHPCARLGGQQAGQGGLSAAGRPPEDDARQVAALGEPPEHVDHLALPDQLVEAFGAHPGRQGGFGL